LLVIIISCSASIFAKKSIKNTAANEITAQSDSQVTTVKDKEAPNKDKIKVYHVYDDIDLVSKIDFQYPAARLAIKTVSPLLSSDVNDESNVQYFNQAVQDLLTEESDKFKQKVAEYASSQKNLPRKSISNKLFIDFDTAAIDSGKNHIVSIRFSVTGYITGMDTPYNYHRVLNFDLDNNQAIEMNELFVPDSNYLAVLSAYCQKSLSRRLSNKDMILQGAAPTEENYKNWNIKPYGLLITFDQGQVAPNIEGAQTVLVSYSKLKSVIASDSPLSACLKHRRRCLVDNLLTGGFIDEI
jgi:hypothetical protein